MSGEEITDYCKKNKCDFVQVLIVANYPHGTYWHYFKKKARSKPAKGGKK